MKTGLVIWGTVSDPFAWIGAGLAVAAVAWLAGIAIAILCVGLLAIAVAAANSWHEVARGRR